ncbi:MULTISPECIES: hypothetical protein [unclassified Vibrio]|uniref:hypothetical protein n=1 Tax=unclassified Vibrio TaxID=2614977 RepID=UPI001110A10D|nr:hypothetical protein [Vibrio sp. Hep-1b-8]TMX35902.1 hypothetical protein DA100_13780 [Vibrio sp. Hep-1b-8]
MTSNDRIETLKEKLYQDKVVYCWEHIGPDGNYSPIIRWLLALFIGLFLPIFLVMVSSTAMWSAGFWFCFVLATIGVLITRYLFIPDKHRCYHLTTLGIHYTEQDMIPEVAYKIVRGFAWVGIVVCVIAVLLLGPLALVGAGAFALMSFGMTNFKPIVDKCCLLIDDSSVAFNLTNDGVMSFAVPEKGVHAFSGDIYISLEQKEELLAYLKKTFPNIEIVKIKRLNDQYKHPVYQRDEESATE